MAWLMIADLRERASQATMRPFRIRLVDGHEHVVPTLDHVWFPPQGGRVAVESASGGGVLLPALFISGSVEPAVAESSETPLS